MDDETLVHACRAGALDQRAAAFGVIVERYRGLVASVCYAETGDAELTRDLTQDTFLLAWRVLGELRDPRRLAAWITSIARNISRNARRRQRELLVAEPEVESADAPQGEQLIDRESKRLVRDALARMPRPYREAVVLFYWEGQSSAQVAMQLGISDAAVQQRLSRARRYLRDEIASRLEGEIDRERRRPTAIVTAAVLAAILAEVVGTEPARAGDAPAPRRARKPVERRALSAMSRVLGALAVIVVGVLGVHAHRATPGGPTHTRFARATPEGQVHLDRLAAAAGLAAEPPGRAHLDGLVVDATDTPVAGATVWIDSAPVRQTTTEADGSFRLRDLVDRTYHVMATWNDLRSRPALYRPATAHEPVILQVTPGASLEVTLINESTLAPAANVHVELESSDMLTATTDDAGRVTFRGLRPADYTLNAWGPPGSAIAFTTASVQVAVAPGGVEHRVVAIPRGAPIGGTLARRGHPVEGAVVVAEPLHASCYASSSAMPEVTTDADGHWQMPALAEGTYRFASRNGVESEVVVNHDGVTPVDGVALEAREAVTLAGHVRSIHGAPVPYATVEVMSTSAFFSWEATGSVAAAVAAFDLASRRGRRELVCDQNGEFHLDNVFNGAVFLRARAGDAASIERQIEVDRAPLDVTLTLERASAIDGVVVTDTGTPLGGAQVIAVAKDPTYAAIHDQVAAIADPDGRFHLGALDPTPYIIVAAPWNADTRALVSDAGLQVVPGAAPVRIVAHDSGTVEGAVRFADGTVPEQFEIAISGDLAFADPGGRFKVSDLAPGTHELRITGPAIAGDSHRDVAITAGATIELGVITVERGATLRGRVVANGSGVAGATVFAGDSITGGGTRLDVDARPPGHARSVVTETDGSFTLTGLAAITSYVIAERPDVGRSAVVTIAPSAIGRGPIELRLQPTGGLEGRVMLDTGQLSRVRITATPVEAPHGRSGRGVALQTAVDRSGRYRFPRLAPGGYRIAAAIGPYYLPGQLGAVGSETFVSRVNIVSGTTTRGDLQVPAGSAVTLQLRWPSVLDQVEAALWQGKRSPVTFGELTEIESSRDDDDMEWRTQVSADVKSATERRARAEFNAVPDGNYTLCAWPQPHDSTTKVACREVQVRGSATADVTIALAPG
jgi:RNA polymerase sigma factor (sigma-70 family)